MAPIILPRTVLLLLTSYLASVHTPLEYTRRFTRDTTPSRRYDAAVRAGERVQVADDVVTFLQLYLLCGHTNPWCLPSVAARIGAAAAIGVDASWQLGTYLDLLAVDQQLVSSSNPIFYLATTYLLRAAESLTCEPPPKRPRTVYRPRDQGHTRTIDGFCESECLDTFRFKKDDLRYLFSALELPNVMDVPVKCSGEAARRSNGGGDHVYHVSGETCFLVFLARFAKYGMTYGDLAFKFGFNDPSLVCRVFNHMLITLDEQYGWLVDGSAPGGNINRWSSQLPLWSDAIQAQFMAKGGVDTGFFQEICLFIDGTFRKMDRPGETGFFADLQRLFYTKYKRAHGFNYQGVTSPNGLVIDLWGPAAGRKNDLNLVTDSDIVHRLADLFANYPHRNFRCYGDSIYQLSEAIVRRFKSHALSPNQERQNRIVNAERTTVEQVFGLVTTLWKYLDIKSNFKLLQSPCGTGRAYRVGCLLTNLKSCIDGNQVGSHFGLKTPEVADYLRGGTNPKI